MEERNEGKLTDAAPERLEVIELQLDELEGPSGPANSSDGCDLTASCAVYCSCSG
jgi:hypothetical protein